MIINMNGAKAPETPSPVLQEKTITPETLPTVIGPDAGYDGLSQVTVNPDSQLIPTNIRSGKTIFGVDGTFGAEASSNYLADYMNDAITELTAEMLDGATTIKPSAFSGSKVITKVTLASTIRTLKSRCFSDCYSITEVNLNDGLESIEEAAFRWNTKLTSINIPDTVTSLGRECFASSGITSCVIPSGVTTIPVNCFSDCRSLVSAILPEGVTTIEEYAFSSTNGLTEITIPSTVTTIGNYAFTKYYAMSARLLPTTPPTVGTNIFKVGYVTSLVVPAGCLEAYQTAEGWSQYADKMVEATE